MTIIGVMLQHSPYGYSVELAWYVIQIVVKEKNLPPGIRLDSKGAALVLCPPGKDKFEPPFKISIAAVGQYCPGGRCPHFRFQ